MATYHFGETSFSNNIWIKGQATFYNPTSISMEKTTNQSVEVRAYTSSGNYVGKAVSPARYNWVTVSLTWLPRGKSYRIQLVNAGSGTVKIKQGDLVYENLIIA